jgi:3-phenylpropionate/trans-cinnamate dioxygenase ferredoxin subunit
MEQKQRSWFKIGESRLELFMEKRPVVQVRVGGTDLCVAMHQEKLYAFASKCPHAGGRFAQGWVDPLGQVVCPLHRYKFALSSGHNTSGEGYHLKTYPIKETEDGVFVGL